MTKEDIKKALEFCAQDNYYFCGGCSYDDVRNCNDKLKNDALNVIIEQEREIGKLKDENEALKNDLINSEGNLNHITTEFERSKEEKKQAQIDVLNKLKEKYGFYSCYSWHCDTKSLNAIIDELIKEVQNGKDKG